MRFLADDGFARGSFWCCGSGTEVFLMLRQMPRFSGSIVSNYPSSGIFMIHSCKKSIQGIRLISSQDELELVHLSADRLLSLISLICIINRLFSAFISIDLLDIVLTKGQTLEINSMQNLLNQVTMHCLISLSRKTSIQLNTVLCPNVSRLCFPPVLVEREDPQQLSLSRAQR